MIPNKEKEGWHYLVVKKISALPHRKTSKDKGDFCLNCVNSFRTENKNKDFCWIAMPAEKKKILEFHQYMKSDTVFMLILNL